MTSERDEYTRKDLLELLRGKENARTPDSGIHWGKHFTTDFFNSYVVYFLVKNDKVVYVGQTKRLGARIGEHVQYGKDFDSFFFIRTTEEDVNILEYSFIVLFNPELNNHNTRESFVENASARDFSKIEYLDEECSSSLLFYLSNQFLKQAI